MKLLLDFGLHKIEQIAARAGVMAARAGTQPHVRESWPHVREMRDFWVLPTAKKARVGIPSRTCGTNRRTCGAHSRTCGPCWESWIAPFYVLVPRIFLKSVFDAFFIFVNSFETSESGNDLTRKRN